MQLACAADVREGRTKIRQHDSYKSQGSSHKYPLQEYCTCSLQCSSQETLFVLTDEIDILLMGAAEAGKSTFIKQLRLLHKVSCHTQQALFSLFCLVDRSSLIMHTHLHQTAAASSQGMLSYTAGRSFHSSALLTEAA
jgi:hypothetical protein